ncbi:hypothetical protein CP01DC11_1182A, partial [Chlamydia psittaci 01DC11]
MYEGLRAAICIVICLKTSSLSPLARAITAILLLAC